MVHLVKLAVLTVLAYFCGAAQTWAQDYQVPTIAKGKYNVGFVYLGTRADGGWTQSHEEGRIFVERNIKDVHTAYIEKVSEGADAEQVIRSLARKGFDAIFTCAFDYMDATAAVAAEFPKVNFIHNAGFKSNSINFGNLYGSMESIIYVAGMVAGARAKADNNPKIGFIASFPIPLVFRFGNAFALGAKQTCPNCMMDVRWAFTWFNPIAEIEAAKSLYAAGAQVVMNSAGTNAAVEAAPTGKWGINSNYRGSCTGERCLTARYWNWGPIYARIVEDARSGKWKGGKEYFDVDSGGLGLFGFMPGETLSPGAKDLNPQDLEMIRNVLDRMRKGEYSRFDAFSGPIRDNQGNLVVPAGQKLTQADLEGFKQFGSKCEICMYWWADNVTAPLPQLKPPKR